MRFCNLFFWGAVTFAGHYRVSRDGGLTVPPSFPHIILPISFRWPFPTFVRTFRPWVANLVVSIGLSLINARGFPIFIFVFSLMMLVQMFKN